MTRFVIDATTLLHVLESGRTVEPSHRLLAPASIGSQVLDVLLRRVREGSLTEPEALALHDRFTRTRLRVLNDRVSRRAAWDLATEHGWDTVRLAECIALARLQGDALVTIDERLSSAAEGIVAVAGPERLFQA